MPIVDTIHELYLWLAKDLKIVSILRRGRRRFLGKAILTILN